MKNISLDATVIYCINGFQQKGLNYFKEYEEDVVGDVVSPFQQNYKYKIKSIFNNHSIFTIDLEPFCDSAKKVFEEQYSDMANVILQNKKAVGKYFIIKDLKFRDFMKDENGKISLYNTQEEAYSVCGIYEFPNVLVCKVEHNHIENE
ncbi:MAG: hypothetical protein WC026_13020 [Hyphomicrobium sp.]|uniref:hypothetical protein n=1 Tax=Hyphomicrobium sp. TaxID=82 RepID=UPI003565B7B7